MGESKMRINQTLKEFFKKECPNKLSDYKREIIEFIDSNINDKYDLAPNLIKNLVELHSKQDLVKQIVELYAVESATMKLTNKRNHVIHAVNTFLLGIYINHKFLNNQVDLFQWKLSSLFHDIAYPLEISQKIINRYFEQVSIIKNNLGIENYNPTINLVPQNIDKLTNNVSAFDLLQQRVYEWDINVNIKKRYDDMINTNKLCHGIISSLTVLFLIDLMYQKNNPQRKNENIEVDGSNWNQENFIRDIVSSCSAIYFHNLHPDSFFKNCKNKSKLAYLLKLSDELQNWDREKMPKGDSPENYDIQVQQNQLIFKVSNHDRKDKIESGIKCLNDADISIQII